MKTYKVNVRVYWTECDETVVEVESDCMLNARTKAIQQTLEQECIAHELFSCEPGTEFDRVDVSLVEEIE